jgi:hypothetical protein
MFFFFVILILYYSELLKVTLTKYVPSETSLKRFMNNNFSLIKFNVIAARQSYIRHCDKMASGQKKELCVLGLHETKSVVTEQRQC